MVIDIDRLKKRREHLLGWKKQPSICRHSTKYKGKTRTNIIACAMQVDTKETSWDINVVHNKNTEFFINMANKILRDN